MRHSHSQMFMWEIYRLTCGALFFKEMKTEGSKMYRLGLVTLLEAGGIDPQVSDGDDDDPQAEKKKDKAEQNKQTRKRRQQQSPLLTTIMGGP